MHHPVASLYFSDDRSGKQDTFFLVEDEIFKIGRDAGNNTFSITDEYVSRTHCEFYVVVYEPRVTYHVFVRDRGSCNGTYVNGRSIGREKPIAPGYMLLDGDEVTVRPHWRFKFKQDALPPLRELTSTQLEETKLFSDRYALTNRCIGDGSEAIVYLAEQVPSCKQVVCKIVNLDEIRGRDARDILRRKFQEPDVLRQLHHPNILPYVDAISSPHTLYTFTELGSGGDLMSFLYRHQVIEEFDARIIIRQVVRALGYLHGKGIVHRDVKPENILLAYSPRIECHRVMLSDFGTCAVPHRSRMLTHVGTQNYQAPELPKNREVQTGAVDIWSLGVVALLLLTTGGVDTKIEQLNKIDQAGIDTLVEECLERANYRPSPSASGFMQGCLQILPADRMTALAADAHDWLRLPKEDFKFFQRLERKMIRGWDREDKVRAMPWELHDVHKVASGRTKDATGSEVAELAGVENEEPSESSPYFKGTDARVSLVGNVCPSNESAWPPTPDMDVDNAVGKKTQKGMRQAESLPHESSRHKKIIWKYAGKDTRRRQ